MNRRSQSSSHFLRKVIHFNAATTGPLQELSHASKILLRVILDRMQLQVERKIAPEQAGFRPKRGTRDHITNLRIILEKARERNQPLYLCFIDYMKAFDKVRHDQLWLTMLDMGFPPHLVQLLRDLYKQQQATIRTA